MAYASPPHSKRDKGLKEDEHGRRPATSKRSRRSDEPAACTPNESGESNSSCLLVIYRIRSFFYQRSSNHLYRFPARRHSSDPLLSLCRVRYSRVRHPLFQTSLLYFKHHVFNASPTIRHHPPSNNPMLLRQKSTQLWRIITLRLISVQVHYLAGPDVDYF